MNEPLLKKANEIIEKHGRITIFNSVKFNSYDTALRALVDFAKFYDKYGHETEEEKQNDGNNSNMPNCCICKESIRCLCFEKFI